MDWTDIAALAALGVSLINLVILSGMLSDIRSITRTVDRQLTETREARGTTWSH